MAKKKVKVSVSKQGRYADVTSKERTQVKKPKIPYSPTYGR